MSSRETEDIHMKLLNKILTDSGLVCERPKPIVDESYTEELVEEIVSVEEESIFEPSTVPDEVPTERTEETQEVVEPEIFPTPSLRRVIPPKHRKIEDHNRIHVLPAEFKTDFDPEAIPRIATTPQQKYIETLAEMVGCTMYPTSLAEFWFLDTMANLLRRAQEDEMEKQTQAVLMLWFCEWMKEMQHFDAATRPRMMRRFKDNMLAAAKYLDTVGEIPTPAQAGVYYMAKDDETAKSPKQPAAPAKIPTPVEPPKLVTFKDNSSQCSLIDFTKIIHYIFDLFNTDYQYDLVRSIFCHTPEHVLIDMPYQIRHPKRMYATVLKVKKQAAVKKDTKAKEKASPKNKGKVKKEDVINEDFAALMELKAREEKEVELQEELDKEMWNKKSHLLPLQFAVTDELFDKYWPPPPPPPEPEKEPEPVKKKKK